MSRLGKALVITAAAMGLCAIGIVVFYSLRFLMQCDQVNAEIAKLKADGHPVSMTDLIGPKIADAENGAVVYDKAFKLVSGPEADRDDKIFSKFLKPPDEPGALSPMLWAKAEAASVRYRGALQLVEEAAAKPKCRFHANWQDGPFNVTFPYYAHLRHLSRIVCSLAVLDARDGKTDQALHSVELGLRMSESLKDEPTLVGQLLRLSLIASSGRALREVLDHKGVSPQQARHLYDLLCEVRLDRGLLEALDGERAMGIACFDQYRRDPASMVNAAPGDKTGIAPSPFLTLWTYADETFYLSTMGQAIAGARLPYREEVARHLNVEPKPPAYAVLTAIWCPVFFRARQKVDQGTSEIAGSRILLALKTYQSKFGGYPQNLGELRSRLGWEIPEDPFSGKDFIYRRQGNGFLLYGIGPDLKDHGGTSLWEAEKRALSSKTSSGVYDAHDIVWKEE